MMKMIIRRLLKLVSFALVFVVLFYACQFVFHYRWSQDEDLYTRNLDFENQPSGSIDVIYFGTSEMYAAVAPVITYASEGITGYNFAVTSKSAVTTYYQLLYALKHHTPQVVVCDFEALFSDSLPDTTETLYRKVYETMPDKEIKNQLLSEIMKLDPNQNYLSWKFPFLRYHSIWSELRPSNFSPDYRYDSTYPSYKKGSLMNSKNFKDEVYDITPDLWVADETSTVLSAVSVKYYDMFIEECQSRNIKVIAVITPKVHAAQSITTKWETIQGYFDSRSVDYLNYNSYEQISRMNLNFKDHYYDTAHLNTLGSVVFSKTLAADLKNCFGLQGHDKGTAILSYWDECYQSFRTEITNEQPDVDKFLLLALELDMDVLVYLNDEYAMNYEKYYTALEKQGIDRKELKSSGLAVLSDGQAQVITDIGIIGQSLGLDDVHLENKDNQLTISVNDDTTTIIGSDAIRTTDLCLVTFDGKLVNFCIFG